MDTTAGCSIQFIGNATTLIRIAGLTILTDPNFVPAGEAVPIGYGMTTRRLRDPALAFDDLPPIDLVLLSHRHGDHFDRIAEDRLDRGMPILTTPSAARSLEGLDFHAARGLETWQSHEMAGRTGRLRVTALPAKHAPNVLAVVLPEVMGSLIEAWAEDAAPDGPPDTRLYISGDTIMFDGLREIPKRHGQPQVGVFHLGGTQVLGVTVTLDADQGVEAVRAIGPRAVVPIHFDDYDAFESPLQDFVVAMEAAGLAELLQPVERGETLQLGAPAAVASGGRFDAA